jgi:tetratricopeptide (TPR) repeat protein
MSASEQETEEKKIPDKAFETYKKALNIDPSSADLHFHAANFFLNRQNYEKAKNHFSAFLELRRRH